MLKPHIKAIVTLIILWSAIKFAFDIPSFILPSPLEVANAFSSKYAFILAQTAKTFTTILFGLTLAALFGFLTSLLLHYFPKFQVLAKPLMLFSQSVPIFALAPLIILFCGFGMASQLTLMCLVLYFTITSNLTAGLQQTPKAYTDLQHLYRFTPTQSFFHIKLPAAMPQFTTGLKIATAYAPVAALLSEWVGAAEGLGALILSSYTRVQIDLMFAAIITLFVLSLTLYGVVAWMMRRFEYHV